MMDVKDLALRGGLAKLLGQVANLGVRLASMMILARLLDPSDFGLVAMVTAITGLFNVLRDFGLQAATVQQTNISHEQLSTIFWINVAFGFCLTGLTVGCAPILVSFYDEPRIFWITIAISGAFLLNSLGLQHLAQMQRQMRFVALAAIDIVALFVSACVGIGMAYYGLKYWALVGMLICPPFVYSLLAWLLLRWIPGPPRRNIGISAMLRFGGGLTLNSIIAYFAYNMDKILLGRYWGADALGVYGRAYQLINIPTEAVNSAAHEVAYSGLSRVRSDPERFRRYFLKGYALVVTFTLPITVICALFAEDLITVFLGPKWVASIQIFQLLAPTTLVFAMIHPMFWLLFALGLIKRSLKITTVLACIAISGYLIGLPYGPNGVALGFSLALVSWTVPHIAWCVHGTVVRIRDVLLVCSRPLIAAIAGGVASTMIMAIVPEVSSIALRLLLEFLIILAVYLFLLLRVMGQKRFYIDLIVSLIRLRAKG